MAKRMSGQRRPMEARRWPINYDNPIWSIVVALANGYVMEPHRPTAWFTKDKNACALYYYAIQRGWDVIDPATWKGPLPNLPKPCKPQCKECYDICYMNDYIRGKLSPHHPVPALS